MGMKKLGSMIKQYRKKKKMTVRKFAAAAGVSPAYIIFLERGENPQTGKPMKPSFEKLQALAKAMEMEPMQLMRDIGIEVAEPEEEREEAPVALSGTGIRPFTDIALNRENLNAALKEGRVLIFPYRIPTRGCSMFVPSLEYGMVIRYTVTACQGGVYTAEAEVGAIQFCLYDIGNLIFDTMSAARTRLRELQGKANGGF